ncbi:MAG: response regulator, partial [Candidatus Nitrotoga sp.]
MADSNDLQEKLKLLCDAYAAQLPEKLKQLEQILNHLPHDSWDEEGMQTLHHMTHNLTGSGKTFGFSLLTDMARNLENHIKLLIQTETALSKQQRSQIHSLISELHQVIQHRDVPAINNTELTEISKIQQKSTSLKHIFIVDDDHEQAEELKIQLSYFGYEVSVFSNLADFRLTMQANPDVVVLMDMSFPGDIQGGIQTIKEIQQKRSIPLSVIFLTAHNEFDARLEAVRAGSIAYLRKPIDINALVDKLD